MNEQMINFTIDGKAISVPKGTTVYSAAKKLGIEIPIFCYQDRMPPFGACRVCLVEVEKMPKLQASCTLVATDGMVVKTRSKEAIEGRESILEFLLINHPLDCPICDKGGECPLQDHALNHGPEKSRFFEEKRHFKKPYPLGPVLMLDRERCIICARCTRFGDLVAGDHALELIDRGYRSEVGTPDGGPARSKFIGNTIQICPVGALTSRVYRFRARPWDNLSTPTTCTLCPVGCSMILDSRDGEILRTRAQENKNVNDMWLCDKGWFGYEFSYSNHRLMTPLLKKNGSFQSITWEEAITLVANKINEFKPNGRLAAFGGNTLTIEDLFTFQQLMRQGIGVNHIDHRIGMNILSLEEEGFAPGMEMEIGECENLSYAWLLGLDLTEEFPVIWLRLKQAINKGAQVTYMGHYGIEIAPHIFENIIHQPGREYEILKKQLAHIEQQAETGKKISLFIGRQYLSSPNRLVVLSEILALKKKYPRVLINTMEATGNSMGARLAGMRPDLEPFGKKIQSSGMNAIQVISEAASNGWDFLYVAGANPAKKFPSKLWSAALKNLKFLIVQDLFMTETAKEADLILPTLSYVEKEGSFMNIEGRVQQILPGKEIPKNLFSDEEIFALIAEKIKCPLYQEICFEEKLQNKRFIPEFPQNIQKKSESASQKALAASFAPELFDEGVRMQNNSHLIQLTHKPKVRIHPQEAIKRNMTNGEEVWIQGSGNAIKAKIKIDPSVSEGTVILPLGFKELNVEEFGPNLMNGMELTIVKL